MTKINPKTKFRGISGFLLVMLLSMFGLNGMAQPMLVENFDYTLATNLTDNGWIAHSGGGSQPITVGTGLSYTGYSGSGVGGAALVDNTGEDDSKLLAAPVTTGTLYVAALMNFGSSTTGYFYHLGGSTSLFAARVFVRPSSTSGKINFGLSNTSTGTFSTADFDLATTYLVIIKYSVSTAGDASLWVVPSGVPASEAAAGTPLLTYTGTGQASIDRICLRQYSATQNMSVDAIRIADNWADAVTPEGTVTPTITVVPTALSGFNYTEGSGPSAAQSFSVSGADLTDNISIAASTDYEISLSSGSGYTSPIVLTQTSGVVDPTTVYVRLKAGLLASGNYNDELINLTSTGAALATVTCSGSVTALTPQLTVAPTTISGFTYGIGNGPSVSNYYSLSGIFLTGFPGSITVTGTTNYEVSNDDATYGPSTTIDYTAATLDPTPVFIRLKAGLAVGTYSGELVSNAGGGAPAVTVTCNGSVTPPLPNATVTLRPSHIDISTTTSESAVLMTLSNYGGDVARYRIYSGSNQYNCWDESLDIYQSNTSYATGPLVPGTPTTTTTFWILSQRGSNNSADGSYRDRLDPYSSNYQTATLPAATSITVPFTLAGTFVPTGGYDNTVKHVVLGYSGATLVSAASTTLTSGAFSMVCPDGTTFDKIEVRATDNTLIASITGTWTATTNVGNIPAGGTPVVTTPVISPLTGNYYNPFSATISCLTPGSSIYYTTNGTDPNNTGNGTLYTTGVPISVTTTLKAIAYASGFDPSAIATEVFTFPVINNVADIAALRASLADGVTVYKLTGEAVLTLKSTTRNAKYIQDATGAILVDDVTGKITTVYNIYDGITGITGTLSPFNGMLQFVPVTDPGVATSSGNTVVPEEVTLTSLTTGHQAKLVKVLNTTITGTGTFVASTTYPLTDPSGAGVMRTQYSDLDYIGSAIPVTPQDITGVILEYTGALQLIPRGLADFTTSSGPIITATPNTLTGFIYGAGNGPSTSQSFSLSGSSLSGYPGNITIAGSASYEVSNNNTTFGASTTVPFTSSTLSAVDVWVRLKAGLVSGEYNSEVVSVSGGGILLPVSVTCSGTVLAGEPTNHATSFAATAPDYSSITVTWSDNDGAQPADGFIILANTTGSFAAPVDGIAQANDAVLSDGTGVMNIAHGVQTYTWAGLNAATPYYFTIYPYTNAGTLIDYKTTPAAPTATATTLAASLPLAAWTFEIATTPAAPNTPGSFAANYGSQLTAMFYADGTNGASTWASSASNPELTAFTGTTLNDPRTTPVAGNAIALANNSANGKSVVFKFSMAGYIDPVLSFATRGTSTGFSTHQWAWSTDGTNFTDFGTNTANTTTTFLARSLDMSAINDLDQAANVYLRLTLTGASSTTGNNRLDNVVINATEEIPTFKTLNASILLEGLYLSGGTMRKAQNETGDQFPGTVADQITIELHDAANYSNITQTISNVNLNQDGSLSTTLAAEFNGSYFITIVHRNSITTTTAAPVSFTGSTITYAFDAPAAAYGSNLLQTGDGYYVIYGGDVNADGVVDTGDVTPFDNDQFNFLAGYVPTDVNGDGSVDTGDGTIIDNNQFNFVGSVTP
ncbi:MAG: FN3 associated domain-containing protein [Bacteroidota bacterium]